MTPDKARQTASFALASAAAGDEHVVHVRDVDDANAVLRTLATSLAYTLGAFDRHDIEATRLTAVALLERYGRDREASQALLPQTLGEAYALIGELVDMLAATIEHTWPGQAETALAVWRTAVLNAGPPATENQTPTDKTQED